MTAAEIIRVEMQRTPAIIGWPFTKAQFLGSYFSMLQVGLDVAGGALQRDPATKELGDALRAEAAIMEPEKLVVAFAREERAVAP